MQQYVAEFPEQVRKNGGSLYIAIPKSWARARGIDPYDRIKVIILDDGCLRIEAVKKEVLK